MEFDDEYSFDDNFGITEENSVLPYDGEEWEFNNDSNENPPIPEEDEAGVMMQPFSQQQLLAYYHNPLLEHNNVYTDRFLENASEYNRTFHNLLIQFFQSVKNLNQLQEDYNSQCSQMDKCTERTFKVGQGQVNAMAYCKDQRKVTKIYTFETFTVDSKAITELKSNFYDMVRVGVDDLTLANYHLLLSQLECEQFLYEAKTKLNFNLTKLKDNTDSNSSNFLVQILDDSFDCVRSCINSLFCFIRKESEETSNKQYVILLIQWVSQLVVLLYNSSHREALRNEEMFILNHIIRCPPGAHDWSEALVQISCPHLETDYWKYKPLLDHVIYMLYLILHPPKNRNVFLSSLKPAEMIVPVSKQKSIEDDQSWAFIRENGEEASGSYNPWHVLPQESDLVSLFCQIPFENLLAHIFGIAYDQTTNRYQYSFVCDNSDSMLQTIACCDLLCDILGEGLANLGAPKYKQLVRRIAQTIRNVVLGMAEHWKKFHKEVETMKVQRHTMLRLQTEFDAFARRCVERLLYVARLGVYQFLADLPFDAVSQRAAEIIYVLMNVPPGSRAEVDQLSRTLYSKQEYMEFVQDSDTKLAFEEQLSSMPENEVVYLITAFSNLAQARPTSEKHLINIITIDIYSVSFVYASTKDICSKMGRELICTVASIHPFVISNLLHFVTKVEVTNSALLALTDLPFSCWVPQPSDIQLLKSWLIKNPIGSSQSKFAQVAILNMNWDVNENGTELFLSHDIHKEIALSLVEVAIRHEEEKRQTGMLGKGMDQMSKVASAMKWTLTLEESFLSWIWDVLSKLKLHNEHLPCSVDVDVSDVNDSSILVQAIRMNLPIGCYVALAITNLGHSMNEFLQQGHQILLTLAQSDHKMCALRCILFLLPMFVKAEVDLSINNSFLLSLNSILRSSSSILEGITNRLTDGGDKTQTYLKLTCGAIQVLTDKESEYTNTLIIYWLKLLLSLQSWHTDNNICGVLDYLLKLAFHSGINCVDECRALLYQQTIEVLLGQTPKPVHTSPQHQNKSMMSSLWGLLSNNSHNLAPSFYNEVLTYFPYLSYFILDAETRYEDDSKLWSSLLKFMRTCNVDVAIKKASTQNKLSYVPAVEQLSIYRWAHQVSCVDIDHPIFALFCQQFFLRYIYMQPDKAGSIGQKFFKFGSLHQHYTKLEAKFTNLAGLDHTTNKNLKNIEKLCQVFLKWLEEPKLHDSNLYIPSLTSHFRPDLLAEIRNHKSQLWIDFIDTETIYAQVMEIREGYMNARKTVNRTKVPTHSSSMSINMTICQRLTQLLRQFEPPKSLTVLDGLQELTCPVERSDTDAFVSMESVNEAIDSDIKLMSSYASDFLNVKSKLETMNDNYTEMLPDLYSMEEASKWVNLECHSTFSSTHKCAGPAHIELKFRQKTMNDEVAQLLKLNRGSYNEQMEIFASKDGVMELCFSSLHIKALIEGLIKNAESAVITSETREEIFKTGAQLFYTFVDFNTGEQWKCPATQQLLTVCLELLGQSFISGRSDQAEPLLDKMLQHPKIAGLLSSHFLPEKACVCTKTSSGSCAFVDMYNRVVSAVVDESMDYTSDVLFVLITKFDIENWLTKHVTSKPDRIQILNCIVTGLSNNMKPVSNSSSNSTITSLMPLSPISMSSQITFSNYAVQEIFTSHLCTLIGYSLEDTFFEALRLLLKNSENHMIDVTAWEALISSAFSSQERIMSKDPAAVQSTIPMISYETCLKSIKYLAVFFSDIRIAKESEDNESTWNLYDAWGSYVQPLAHVMHCISVTFIHHFFASNTEDKTPTYVLNEFIFPLFYAWLKATPGSSQTVNWPWTEQTQHYADYTLQAFSSILSQLSKLSHDNPIESQAFLSSVWQYYSQNVLTDAHIACPSFICSSYQTSIHNLKWDTFLPDFNDLNLIVGLVDTDNLNCIHFLCFLLPQIQWEKLLQDINVNCGAEQSMDITQGVVCRILHCIIVLCSQPNRLVSYPELNNLIVRAKGFPWQCITFSQFDFLVNIISEKYSADCLVKKVVEDKKTETKIMTEPRYAVVDLIKCICGLLTLDEDKDDSTATTLIYPQLDSEIWFKRQSFLKCCGNLFRKSDMKVDPKLKFKNIYKLEALVSEFVSDIYQALVRVAITTDLTENRENMKLLFIELWSYLETFPESLQKTILNALITSTQVHKAGYFTTKNVEVLPDTAFILLFDSACKVLTNPQFVGKVSESMLEIAMCLISSEVKNIESEVFETNEKPSSVGVWISLVECLKEIKCDKADVFNTCVDNNHFLTIYALCQNMFAVKNVEIFDESMRERAFDAVLSLVQWMSAVTPIADNEIKLIFWFDYFFYICVFLLKVTADNSDSNINIFSVTDSLASILPTLENWSLDKIRSGLLGSLGIGRSSALSTQFRITTRALIVYVKLHLARLIPNDDVQTQTANDVLKAFNALPITNKTYTEYSEQISIISKHFGEELLKIQNYSSLLDTILRELFPNHQYFSYLLL